MELKRRHGTGSSKSTNFDSNRVDAFGSFQTVALLYLEFGLRPGLSKFESFGGNCRLQMGTELPPFKISSEIVLNNSYILRCYKRFIRSGWRIVELDHLFADGTQKQIGFSRFWSSSSVRIRSIFFFP